MVSLRSNVQCYIDSFLIVTARIANITREGNDYGKSAQKKFLNSVFDQTLI